MRTCSREAHTPVYRPRAPSPSYVGGPGQAGSRPQGGPVLRCFLGEGFRERLPGPTLMVSSALRALPSGPSACLQGPRWLGAWTARSWALHAGPSPTNSPESRMGRQTKDNVPPPHLQTHHTHTLRAQGHSKPEKGVWTGLAGLKLLRSHGESRAGCRGGHDPGRTATVLLGPGHLCSVPPLHCDLHHAQGHWPEHALLRLCSPRLPDLELRPPGLWGSCGQRHGEGVAAFVEGLASAHFHITYAIGATGHVRSGTHSPHPPPEAGHQPCSGPARVGGTWHMWPLPL